MTTPNSHTEAVNPQTAVEFSSSAAEGRQVPRHAEPADATTGVAPDQGTALPPQDAYAEQSGATTAPVPPVAGNERSGAGAPPMTPDPPHADAPQPHDPHDIDALFADTELADLRARWNEVQAAFVDDPKDCVQKADGLVSSVVDQLTAGFAQARSHLEEQWSRGEDASTEDLRIALKRYRDFFDRLLSV
jgi:hypothetical protein